ncbi:MAG: IS1634 family transposase [Candidatus Omnitrophota bacterium]|nr:IS1634 family transposase [Candidatus Omnitrophota bacterium]
MATIQAKKSRGHKYWYIVESQRVGGKPRPIVLAYLGKANDLLRRLHGLTEGLRLKSYSHGAVAALLKAAHVLDVPALINQHVKSTRPYTGEQPTRHHLTVGMTLLLGAIGRVCMPTSKRGWWSWAKTTSCQYLLRCSLSKIDSQHFWDLMDALPVESIAKIEQELVRKVFQVYQLKGDSLFFDTTNFFTYIDSANERCRIARRGRNKQKRYDLRQVGLAMVVTRQDMIPIFHLTYQGNLNDITIFGTVVRQIKTRMQDLNLNLEQHTLVFDRGNNSKTNLGLVKQLGLYYVGALTPYHHKELINEAIDNLGKCDVDGETILTYRDKRIIWDEERTVVVLISEKLKAGQIRGIYQSLEKTENRLQAIQKALCNPGAKRRSQEEVAGQVEGKITGQFVKRIIEWEIKKEAKGKLKLAFSVNQEKLDLIHQRLGLRILMTNRHDWATADIIKTYHGQSRIEQSFKNLKNPHHLALKPQYHWTNHKIRVHFFMCVLGYLLAAIVWRQAKNKTRFAGSLNTLLDTLNNVRLGTLLEKTKSRGRVKTTYVIEETSDQEDQLLEALEIKDLHKNRPKFNGVGVYR